MLYTGGLPCLIWWSCGGVPGWPGLGGGGVRGGVLPLVPLPGLVWAVSDCQSQSLSSWHHGSTCSAGVESRMGD